MKKKPGMTDAEWKAYRARVERRAMAAKAALEAPADDSPDVIVQVGAMTAHVEAGPDEEFGTKDDVVKITPTNSMSRSELLDLAAQKGIEVSHKASKKDILALLN